MDVQLVLPIMGDARTGSARSTATGMEKVVPRQRGFPTGLAPVVSKARIQQYTGPQLLDYLLLTLVRPRPTHWSDHHLVRPCLSLFGPPRPAEHELVAIGVLAHGKVWRLAVLWFRFPIAFATGSDDLGRAGHYIRHLEGQPGPGWLTLSASVDRNQATSNGQLRDMGVFSGKGGPEYRLVKFCGAGGISRPYGVLEFFNLHAFSLAHPVTEAKGKCGEGHRGHHRLRH